MEARRFVILKYVWALAVLVIPGLSFASGPIVYPAPSPVNPSGVMTIGLTAPIVTLTDGGLVFQSRTAGEAGAISWDDTGKKLQFGVAGGVYICYGSTVDCTGGDTGEIGGGFASFSNYLIPGGGFMFAPLYISSVKNGFMLNNGGYEFLDNSIPAGWLHEDGTTGEVSLQTGMGRAGGTPSGVGYLFDSYAAYTGTIAQWSINGSGKATIDSNGVSFTGTAPHPIATDQTVAQGIQHGTAALSSGAHTVTFSPAFSTTPVICTCADSSAIAAVKCVANATAVILGGTGTDNVSWICMGPK
jgi:hypothetical protein